MTPACCFGALLAFAVGLLVAVVLMVFAAPPPPDPKGPRLYDPDRA